MENSSQQEQNIANSSSNPEILIVGAGVFSLCFAYNVTNNPQALDGVDPKPLQNWQIYEASREFGGLAMSMKDENGFTWDIGGHVTFDAFGKYYQMLDTLGMEFNHISRNSKVWCHSQMIDYPIQMHIWQMKDEDRDNCLQGLIQSVDKYPNKPENYEEWCRKYFGDGIYDIFFEPYNEKIWGVKLNEMNVTWTGARFPTIDVEEIKQSIHDKTVKQWGHNAQFRYPKFGGNGSQWNRVAELLPQDKLNLGFQLIKIDPKSKIAHFSNGETRKYDKIISSMPLTHLIDLIDIEDPLLKSIDKTDFIYSTAYIIGFGISGPKPDATKDLSWAYFPDKDIPFYRVTWLSNYSEDLVPDSSQHWSLLLEVNVKSLDEKLRQSSIENNEEVQNACLEALYKLNIIPDPTQTPDIKIISRYTKRVEYSYPVPFVKRDSLLEKILPHLEKEYGIYSRGRFGDWKYEISNQDQIFVQTVELAKKIVQNLSQQQNSPAFQE
eukprot:403375600